MQNIFRPTVNNGMPGVVAALAANDHVGFACEYVDNLTFPFIAPLRAD